ncbi:UNVERIFIED_CONTAM: hypothetical protein Sangu_2192100 [Sesamum angustifolium]|uniref:Uncharacterized protein n=1 Tax=Sesamum angustifolium TaxID=2727405 RepID=A0AAW2LFM3_9LAMI
MRILLECIVVALKNSRPAQGGLRHLELELEPAAPDVTSRSTSLKLEEVPRVLDCLELASKSSSRSPARARGRG